MKANRPGAPAGAANIAMARVINRNDFTKRIMATVIRLQSYRTAGPRKQEAICVELQSLLFAVREIYAFDGTHNIEIKDDARQGLLMVKKMLRGSLAQTDLVIFSTIVTRDLYMVERMELHALKEGLRGGSLSSTEIDRRFAFAGDLLNKTIDPRNISSAVGLMTALLDVKSARLKNNQRQKGQQPNAGTQTGRRQNLSKRASVHPLQSPLRSPVVISPRPLLPRPTPSFAREINQDASLLHRVYGTLTPTEQHTLITKIASKVSQFGLDLRAQANPNEQEAMASVLEKLATSRISILCRLDKDSRELVKEALETLSNSKSPRMKMAARVALSQMTPSYVKSGLSLPRATLLLTQARTGTFVIGSQPGSGNEYTVYVKTPVGVKAFPLKESKATNGAVLYRYRTGSRYTGLSSLVDLELKKDRGLIRLDETQPRKNPATPKRSPRPAPQVTPKVQGPVSIRKGVKFGKKQVGKVRISHIRSENGNEYIVSNTQAKGGFGKFRYAVDKAGKRWAIKEFRSQFAPHKSNPKTYVTEMDAIKDEIATMAKVGASVMVKDVMNIDGKVYAVMPLMAGEVGDAVKSLPKSSKRYVARSVLRQMAEDLEQCHLRGYVHRDVKLQNALWNPDGKVAVSDFGLSTKVPPGSKIQGGAAGTPGYIAPELYKRVGYDTKADTWSLALAITDIHVDWWNSPFSPPRGRSNSSWEKNNFADFKSWRQGLITSQGIDTRLIGRGRIETKWDTYFKKLRAADPVLCRYILGHMLVTNPQNRDSMAQVKAFMNTVQQAGSGEEDRSQKAFKILAGDTHQKDSVFKLLERER